MAKIVEKIIIDWVEYPLKDTTYESKSASSWGTDLSLVTTGEKYTWNNKASMSDVTQVSTTAPSNPTQWMLWYDTTNNKLKTYDWSNWNEEWWWDTASVISWDSWVIYTIKTSTSAPASWTASSTLTFVK